MAEIATDTLDDEIPPPPAERPKSRARVVLGWVFKLALLVGIFYYLFHTKKLTLEGLQKQSEHWGLSLLAMALAIPAVLVCTLRYQLLLRALKITASFKDILALSMIGMLFDLFAVATGGDLVKAMYLSKSTRTPGGKNNIGIILFSVLIDRIVGLFALFTFALIVCVVAWPQIGGKPELRRTAAVIVAACIGGLLAFFVLVSEKLENSPLRKRIMHIVPFHEKLERIYAGFAGLRHHKKNLLVMLLLSIVNHVCSCAAVLILANGMIFFSVDTNLPAPLEIIPCLTVLPLGMFAMTFGVAGGLGVGNAAFDSLFEVVLRLKGGAGLILQFQICSILFRLLGVPVLMFYKHKGVSLTEAPTGTKPDGTLSNTVVSPQTAESKTAP